MLRIVVDVELLRMGAEAVSEARGERSTPVLDLPAFGSRSPGSVSEWFGEYWESGRSELTVVVEELQGVLQSFADEYERRDAVSADSFRGGARAF